MPDPAIPQPRLWRMALIRLLLFYEAGKQDAAAARPFTFLTLCKATCRQWPPLCSTGLKETPCVGV